VEQKNIAARRERQGG